MPFFIDNRCERSCPSQHRWVLLLLGAAFVRINQKGYTWGSRGVRLTLQMHVDLRRRSWHNNHWNNRYYCCYYLYCRHRQIRRSKSCQLRGSLFVLIVLRRWLPRFEVHWNNNNNNGNNRVAKERGILIATSGSLQFQSQSAMGFSFWH